MRDEDDRLHYYQVSCAGMTLFWNALGKKLVRERDLFTLLALVNNAHPWTGHVWPTAKTCFEEAQSGMSRTNIADSLTRLRRADLIKRFEQPRMKSFSYAVNPRLIGVGKPDAQRRLWEKWQADKI